MNAVSKTSHAAFEGPMMRVARLVALSFGLSLEEIRGNSQQHHVAHPRQVAFYIARKKFGKSAWEIGRFFNRDHSTVLHGFRAIEMRMEKDPDLRSLVGELTGHPDLEVAASTRVDDVFDAEVETLKNRLRQQITSATRALETLERWSARDA